MRRGILIMLGILMVFALVATCFADTVGGTSRLEYSVYIKNSPTNAAPLTYIVPITTIRPKVDKLVGYSLMPSDPTKSSEVWVGIFDGTDAQLSGECFAEDEADNDNGGIKDHWARGKKIVNGIVTRQGANTDLQLYFVRE